MNHENLLIVASVEFANNKLPKNLFTLVRVKNISSIDVFMPLTSSVVNFSIFAI